jgi:peptidoglycan/LPS O-acetylase OafA/YrhL
LKDLSNRILGLDILRSLAILMVVFAHASTLFNPLIYIPFLGIFVGKFLAISGVLSFLAIELFFVLSGFLISKILLDILSKEKLSFDILFRKFWIRRWLRTLPNYYWILFLNILIFCVIIKKYTFDRRYLFFLQNIYTPHPSFFREAWSLAVEEWYYLISPLVLITFINLLKHNVKSAFLFSSIAILVAIVVLKLIFVQNTTTDFDEDIRKIVIFRFDSLCIGAITSWLYHYYKAYFFKYKNVLFIISCILLLFFINIFYLIFENNYELYRNNMYIKNFINYGFSPISAVLFAMCFPYFYSIKNIKIGNIFFAITSKISYSMYLIHLFIYYLFFHQKIVPNTITQSLIFGTIYFVAVYVLSYINYQLIEKLFLGIRDSKFPNIS